MVDTHGSDGIDLLEDERVLEVAVSHKSWLDMLAVVIV